MDYSFLKSAQVSQVTSGLDIPSFLGTLFQFRDKIHLAHLHTTSYAAHKATETLYKSLLDQIDTLVETAQTDTLLSITIPQSDSNSSNEQVANDLLNFVRTNRGVFPYSFQQQILDNIEELASKTVYKLKFLK